MTIMEPYGTCLISLLFVILQYLVGSYALGLVYYKPTPLIVKWISINHN